MNQVNDIDDVAKEAKEINETKEANEMNDVNEVHESNEVHDVNEVHESNEVHEANKVHESNEVHEANKVHEKKLDLIEQFTRIEWLFHRYHQQNHTQHGPMGDSRRGQGRVLAILKLQPEISQKDLSYLLDMRPQSLGELLTKLEKNGYITRTSSEADRRVMNIKLTKEGTEATEQEFSFDKLFECLNEEEQQNMSSYLNRIIETLEAQLGDEEPRPGIDGHGPEGNPFHNHFAGQPNWTEDRGFHGRGFHGRGGDPHGERGQVPEGRPGDPRVDMGHKHPERMPYGQRSGMMPFGQRDDIPFDHHNVMGQRPGEHTKGE